LYQERNLKEFDNMSYWYPKGLHQNLKLLDKKVRFGNLGAMRSAGSYKNPELQDKWSPVW